MKMSKDFNTVEEFSLCCILAGHVCSHDCVQKSSNMASSGCISGCQGASSRLFYKCCTWSEETEQRPVQLISDTIWRGDLSTLSNKLCSSSLVVRTWSNFDQSKMLEAKTHLANEWCKCSHVTWLKNLQCIIIFGLWFGPNEANSSWESILSHSNKTNIPKPAEYFNQQRSLPYH